MDVPLPGALLFRFSWRKPLALVTNRTGWRYTLQYGGLMDDFGKDLADDSSDMVSEGMANASTELRKRRSTRIVQAVPLVVTGVDALGRPFVERTSSLIINCHGCRYQSKHYVLKNMWVTIEIPHQESGQPPRTVRGRVAWIQRPRTVRQLFQVALELEIPSNVWGIAFPPEDWVSFPPAIGSNLPSVMPQETVAAAERAFAIANAEPSVSDPEMETASAIPPADNVRVFPAPASATDASLQLARQVARLVADAKQQINATARETITQAASAEQRAAFEQWEQKFAAAREEVANEANRAMDRIRRETEEHTRSTHAAAAEALKQELPGWVAPQLEKLAQELTEKIAHAGAAQREAQDRQLAALTTRLNDLLQQAESASQRISQNIRESEARISEQAGAVSHNFSEAFRHREESLAAQQSSINEAATSTREHLAAAANEAQSALHAHVTGQIETARMQIEQAANAAVSSLEARALQGLESRASELHTQFQNRLLGEAAIHTAAMQDAAEGSATAAEKRFAALRELVETESARLDEAARRAQEASVHLEQLERSLAAAKESAAASLTEQALRLQEQFKEQLLGEAAHHTVAFQNATATAASDAEQKFSALREALQSEANRMESTIARSHESLQQLEQFYSRIAVAQQEALSGFQLQLDDVLSLHRNELHRRSESLYEELRNRVESAFSETNKRTLSEFEEQARNLVEPHVTQTNEAIHRLAGGRALLDAALTLQQDRIRNSADEAFAESLARFRENLGGVEQLLQDSSQTVISRNLTELETKAGDVQHQAVEEIYKSAEWYEKKIQTQVASLTEKAVENVGNHLRERAGEISSVFATELDHSSRNFLHHAQSQMEETVRDAFERSRLLFAEAADTTSAAFTDEIQRHAREELDGFSDAVHKSAVTSQLHLEAKRVELGDHVNQQQEDFLKRFRESLSSALELGVSEARQKVEAGFAPILESWKAITADHQNEMRQSYSQLSDQAAEQYRNRLENVSNSWMVATVTTLDKQARDLVSSIAASAEEKMREACAQVFAGLGDTLKERLHQLSPEADPPKSRAADNSK